MFSFPQSVKHLTQVKEIAVGNGKISALTTAIT